MAAAAATVVLIGGTGLAAWQAQVASVERRKALQRSQELRERARSVLSDYDNRIAASEGSTEARARLVQDALKYLDDLAQEGTGDRELMRALADGYERLAAVQGASSRTFSGTTSAADLSDTASAEASQQKAVAIREELVRQTGSEANRLALAKTYAGFGALYDYSGRGPAEKAVHYLQNAIQILESLLGPGAGEEVRSLLATSYLTIAKVYGSQGGRNLGDTRIALAYMRGALKMQRALVADFPANIDHQQGLAAIHNALSQLYSAMGEREEALEQMSKALAVSRKIVAAQPENVSHRREFAVHLENTGTLLVQLKDMAQALNHFREALAIYEQLKADGKLTDADASKPDGLTREIAKCDAALRG